jgi:hypothetical protein
MLRNRNGRGLCALIVIATLTAGTRLAPQAGAGTISSGNSSITIVPNGWPFVSNWVVNGVDQYGGSPAGGEALFFTINDTSRFVTPPDLTVAASSFTGNTASVTLTTTGCSITVSEVLTGGAPGSGNSQINETVTGTNTGTSTLVFELTDNIHWNLDAIPGNGTVTVNQSTATQTDPEGIKAVYIMSPTASGPALSTNGASGPFFDVAPPDIGTGNVDFDYNSQTYDIAPGGSQALNITETLSGVPSGSTPPSIVPLPSSAWSSLAMLGAMGLFVAVRRARQAI